MMKRCLLLVALSASVLMGTTACAPLVIGGAFAGGVMMVSDRRTSGAQIEDQGIELRAINRLGEALGEKAHINVTSYNRQVLLTGEVPTEKDREMAAQIVSKIENVKSVANELGVLGNSSLSSRSSDSLITSRVKTALLQEKSLTGDPFKIVTERGVVYMMGRVSQAEAEVGTSIARGQSGVQKVVKVLEVISDEELKQLLPKPAPKVVENTPTPVLSGSGQPVMTNTNAPK